MYNEYSARSVLPQHRARYWQETTSAVIFPMEVTFREPDRFNGTLKSWDLGSVALINLQTSAARYVRRREHVRSDGGTHALVSFSTHSDVAFAQDGIDLLCRKKQFFLEKTQQTSDFVQEDVNEIWVLKLPISSLRRHIRTLEPFYSSLYDGDAGIGGLLFDMVRQIPHRYGQSSALAAEGVGQALLELLALAIESDDRALSSGCTSVQRGHLTRIEKYIRQNLSNPDLSPNMIAVASNISLRYLHALFHRTGSSVTHYIREARLESCRAQICKPSRRDSLSEIAYRWGFGDQSQFSRHFKARFGMTPREMRADAARASYEQA